MDDTMRDRAYLALKAAGLNAYLPGQYDGECKKPYVTVKNGGTVALSKATGYLLIVITVHVPLGRLTLLDDILVEVRQAMLPVRALRPRGDVTPEVINDMTKAYEASIEYETQCRIG